jgi:deazaflavin-dependent oxidoreductase (nitroreductase family)
MTGWQRWRRRLHVAFWHVVNPPTRPLAGFVPWWVLLETTGRRTGRVRRVPLAAGPRQPDGMWLIAVHGRRAGWVANMSADPRVRVRTATQWRSGVAEVHPFDATTLARFNRYARGGPALLGIDPLLVFVRWDGVTSGGGQSS